MSFGFSISDFVTLARWSWYIYDAIRTGPKECQAFSRELLQFHHILKKFEENVRNMNRTLETSENLALSELYISCHELLFGEIAEREWSHESQSFVKPDLFQKLKDRFHSAKFVRKIPKLQRQVAAHIENLTAYNVLVLMSNQRSIQDSQNRTEASLISYASLLKNTKDSTDHIEEKLKSDEQLSQDSLNRWEVSQSKLESSQLSIAESQARIERRLEHILAKDDQRGGAVVSHSLDASSPEGRQTWMNLGRLLRKEGITPSQVEKNKDALIRAMKATLGKDGSRAESLSESYQTAPEYPKSMSSINNSLQSCNVGSPVPSRSQPSIQNDDLSRLLGSAPPRTATFSPEFLKRNENLFFNFERDQNMEVGMSNLREGMLADPFDEIDNDDFSVTEELSEFEAENPTQEMKRKTHKLLENFSNSLIIQYHCNKKCHD